METQRAQSTSAVDDLNLDQATISRMGNINLGLRALYVTAAAFLGVAAGLSLVGQKDLGLIFFAFYVLFFSLLLCLFQVGISVSLL